MHPLSPDHLLQTALGQRAARALLSAVELGLFTELARGPRTARQLRGALGLDARAAPDLLDALVAMAVLDREGDDARAVYLNTREAGRYLDRRSPAYLGAALADAAGATGPTGNPHAHAFDVLAERFDFGAVRTLVYVDADGAELAGALALHHPQLRVERVDGVAAGWPEADAIALVGVLGAIALEARHALLRRAHAALPAGGCLVVMEALIDDARRTNLFALLASLAARQGAGFGFGRAEFDGWCVAAGFREMWTIPLALGCDAAIARK